MAFSIGLRVYHISLQRERGSAPVALAKRGAETDVFTFMSSFIHKHQRANDRQDLQRSWYFEPHACNDQHSLRGLIRYGTYGFESRFVDVKTKAKNYTRKVTDLEEIPLYYQFWFPNGQTFGLAAFQSFQARSCVTIVTSAIRSEYEDQKGRYRLIFKKLMPWHLKRGLMGQAPVKGVTFIKKSMPRDDADKYLKNVKPNEVEVEFSIKAKKRQYLGIFSDFFTERDEDGQKILMQHGLKFDEAKAEIEFGGRRRVVGVIGYDSNAGTIEMADAVEIGADGHPTFQSVSIETDAILKEFYKTLARG